MENTSNENDANQSFKSPPRRRRSTFFERRDSIGMATKSILVLNTFNIIKFLT